MFANLNDLKDSRRVLMACYISFFSVSLSSFIIFKGNSFKFHLLESSSKMSFYFQ